MSRYQLSGTVQNRGPCRCFATCWASVARAIYQWRGHAQLTPAMEQAAAQATFMRNAQRCGTRRLRAELRAGGHAVGRYALRSWLHRHGLRALSTRSLRPRTTVANPAALMAENCLLGQSAPTAPNQV